MRSRLAVILVATAAALVASSSAAGSTPACHGGELRGHLLNSSGAAGTILLSVTLTNTGSACSVRGFAGLLLVRGNKPLPTHVLHGGLGILDQRPRLVVLRHGGVATVLIAYSDVPTGNESRCRTSTAILVTPPPTRRVSFSYGARVRVRTQACNHGTLRESPVLAGRRKAS